jgi:2-dehydropantoate 2-reductase
MDTLIIGIGALACLFTARMVGAGIGVTLLGSWPEGLAALRQRGVRLLEMDGSEHTYPVRVINDPSGGGTFKQALVLVKSWQTERAAQQLNRCLSSDGVALTLQNGLGNYETLKATLGLQRVLLGVTTVGANMIGPGYVRLAGNGKVVLGAHPRLEPLADRLHQAGFPIEIVADPESLLWGKLVINAAINPLTALLRVPNGALLERPSAHQLMADAAQEAAAVAVARGIRLPYLDPVTAAEEVARNTASNISSMLQDVLRGTPTEIDAINGAIVREGEKLSVPTPVNQMLWKLVKGLDYQDRGIIQ